MKNLFKKKSAQPEDFPIEEQIEEQIEEKAPVETDMEAMLPEDTSQSGCASYGEATSKSLPENNDSMEVTLPSVTPPEEESEESNIESREAALSEREKALEAREKALEAERKAFEELTAASDGVPALGGTAAGSDRRRPSTIFDLAGFAR